MQRFLLVCALASGGAADSAFSPRLSRSIRCTAAMSSQPPDDIGAADYPLLGLYSSRDRSILEKHFRAMHSAGIDVAVVSWLPPSLQHRISEGTLGGVERKDHTRGGGGGSASALTKSFALTHVSR